MNINILFEEIHNIPVFAIIIMGIISFIFMWKLISTRGEE
jgi:hypothetical protein